jgi:hypothetical protein
VQYEPSSTEPAGGLLWTKELRPLKTGLMGIICGADASLSVSMMPQCLWEIMSMASTSSPTTIPRMVSFEQPSHFTTLRLHWTYVCMQSN